MEFEGGGWNLLSTRNISVSKKSAVIFLFDAESSTIKKKMHPDV